MTDLQAPTSAVTPSTPSASAMTPPTAPTSTMTREEALRVLAERFKSQTSMGRRPSIIKWAENRYYLAPGSSTESMFRFAVPIRLMPHQRSILNLMFHHPHFKFTNKLYSTVKKSGKTAIGGLVARYLCECSGFYSEIYCLANDEEQARGRNYKAAVDSIENTPGYDDRRKLLAMTPWARSYLMETYGPEPASKDIEWRIIERQAEYLPTKSYIRALSSDYRGEAGANPTATIWSEIWGLDSEKSKKLWAELTPAPTRPSERFIETYAGYENESIILEEVWDLAMQGRQLTRQDLIELTIEAQSNELIDPGTTYTWPEDQVGYRGHPDKLPLWINEDASMMAYVDQGMAARRMVWQTPDYYKEQEQTLEPIQNERFHFNEWTSTVSPFIDIMWWRNCSIRKPLNPIHSHTPLKDIEWGPIEPGQELRPLVDPQTRRKHPLVQGTDAAVSNDYMATAHVSREGPHKVALRKLQVWKPEDQPNGRFDYEETIMPYTREVCKTFNVVEWTYDPYQLHKVATDLERSWVCSCFPFNQGTERLKADKQLHDLIRDREIVYDPLELGSDALEAFEEALRGCAMKQSKDEDTKFRIIKKNNRAKIDPVIAVSMAAERALYLNLW